jgi:hypothetical protein
MDRGLPTDPNSIRNPQSPIPNRRWLPAVALSLLAAIPVLAAPPGLRETHRIRIGNRKGAAVEVSLDGGRTWVTIGRVVKPATDSAAGFAALAQASPGCVAAISRDGITIRTDHGGGSLGSATGAAPYPVAGTAVRPAGQPNEQPLLPAERKIRRKLHQTIRKVTADTESLDYNTAIAAMMEYVNVLRDAGCATRDAVEPLLVMVAPYAPHLAEELWALLGRDKSIFTASWPQSDAKLAAAGDVEIVVQVNGKVRGHVTAARGATEAQVVALAMQDESVRKFVDGKPVRKTVYVQDRLLNLVV